MVLESYCWGLGTSCHPFSCGQGRQWWDPMRPGLWPGEAGSAWGRALLGELCWEPGLGKELVNVPAVWAPPCSGPNNQEQLALECGCGDCGGGNFPGTIPTASEGADPGASKRQDGCRAGAGWLASLHGFEVLDGKMQERLMTEKVGSCGLSWGSRTTKWLEPWALVSA